MLHILFSKMTYKLEGSFQSDIWEKSSILKCQTIRNYRQNKTRNCPTLNLADNEGRQ